MIVFYVSRNAHEFVFHEVVRKKDLTVHPCLIVLKDLLQYYT